MSEVVEAAVRSTEDSPSRPTASATPPASKPLDLRARGDEIFHVLVDAVDDYAIFLLDPQGAITSWNPGAERIMGFAPAEIIGQHFSRFYTPEDVARDLPGHVLRTAEAEGRCHIEGWRVRKDGRRFWGEVTVAAIREDDAAPTGTTTVASADGASAHPGRLIGFAKVTRDLTERHAADEALRESEERFRLLIEGVIDYAIFTLDPDGFVTSWNVGAERIKGYTAAEIIGQHFSRFYPEEARAAGRPQEILQEAVRTGRVEEENIRVRKDGTTFWANVVITALRDSTGTLRGFAKVTRDLTERRRAEADRREREAAEAIARLRSEFLSVAAHELKTPLASLRGMAQLTLRRYMREGEVQPERIQQALTVIDGQSSRLARLVEQLLDISRLEAGHLTPERHSADLATIVQTVVDIFRMRGDGDRITLDLPDQPVIAPVDVLRIEQVITNLIDNALKYSPADTPVHVSLAKPAAPAAPAAPPAPARISVTDRGPGVPEEDRPRLFDRFFRSQSTNYTSGMGLGLFISREIVELHGGTIRADFLPEGGSRFEVDLPTT